MAVAAGADCVGENGRSILRLAEVALDFTPGRPFVVVLDHPSHEAQVTYDGQTLEFHYDPPGHRAVPSYRASLSDLRTIRIFVDVGLIEIYADGGRACCTKRIDSPLPFTAARLASGSPTITGRVWPLRSPGQEQG